MLGSESILSTSVGLEPGASLGTVVKVLAHCTYSNFGK